jgi:bifunctional pyridoxal-dependent enzyme with beta-cystathionase and maltose regulon repressor activities
MKDSYDFSDGTRGPVIPSKGKTRITIMLDDAVIQAARERADLEGVGYQTLINSVLKDVLCTADTAHVEHKIDELVQAVDALTQQQQTLLQKLERMGTSVAETPPAYGAPQPDNA